MNNKIDLKFLLAVALVILSIASRFLPLPPNFSPIMAVALFSGVIFADRKIAMIVPIAAMFISDIVIGLHPTMLAVYLSFAIIALLGMRMKSINAKNVVGNSLLAAVIFFVVTNLGVFAAGWYSYTLEGLTTCFTMAIPFFRATLASSVLYSGILFGGVYLAEKFAFTATAPAIEK
ncbi:MAG: hypothetical protein LBO69_04180 [Ignavibacteria bacterium]|jgi:hypothetical protein|nr:hypothetical protein [Ignavibacteria bacterium]